MALISLILFCQGASGASKRDFRGAWIQTVFQGYDKRTTEQNQSYLRSLLDNLQATGINAVIFQVRPAADSFYPSPIEPWSRHLTGCIGAAPARLWDPLQFMIDECHKRGMEIHAWLNPYRVTASANEQLPDNHLCNLFPKRFVKYCKRIYFNPALPENRQHIVGVVRDIITRYDVDGIHFDDYFYPYPSNGEEFDDEAHYRSSGTKLSKPDWRRRNVDILIESVHQTISETKPWVRFGISPFGIWRNNTSDPEGSATSGLQNYDDLYADVPRWAAMGWIDYQIPQLYWETDHQRASYRVLCDWWADHGEGRHIYIGQDVKKTADACELPEKLRQIEEIGPERIQGNCWWYAGNLPAISAQLKEKSYSTPALVPEYLWKHVEPADKPGTPVYKDGKLRWNADDLASKWVVYRFDKASDVDVENPSAIKAVTYRPEFIPDCGGCYVITALDRANGESDHSSPVTVSLP